VGATVGGLVGGSVGALVGCGERAAVGLGVQGVAAGGGGGVLGPCACVGAAVGTCVSPSLVGGRVAVASVGDAGIGVAAGVGDTAVQLLQVLHPFQLHLVVHAVVAVPHQDLQSTLFIPCASMN